MSASLVWFAAVNGLGTWGLLWVFIVAGCLAAMLTRWLISKPLAVGLDRPDGWRKQHQVSVPRLGGVSIFLVLALGWMGATLVDPEAWTELLPLWLGNAIVFSVGLIDDLRPLGARVKFLGQLGAALLLYAMGVSVDVLSNPVGEGSLQLGFWSLPVTLLWLVAVPNIINLVDGMDGLAAGVGLLLSLTLAIVAGHNGQQQALVLALLMAGAISGFLIFNLPPARVFLGDGGAYLIGFFVASLSLRSSQKGSMLAALMVVGIALGLPILDTAFAIMRRAVRGVSIFSADADHIHHRLMLLGYSKARALMAMYGACLMLCLVGLSILIFKGMLLAVLLALLSLAAIGVARYLGYVRRWGALRSQWKRALARRRQIEYFKVHAAALQFDLEQCSDLSEFDELLRGRLKWLGLLPGEGRPSMMLTLCGGGRACMALPGDETTEPWLRARALDAFGELLDDVVERFGALPSCVCPEPTREAQG